jgi:FG-GAP repeat
VFSGRSGAVLHVFTGLRFNEGFGSSLCGTGDIDGDGYGDLAVAANEGQCCNPPIGPGYVRVLSGRDGSEIRTLRGGPPGHLFGNAVANGGDLDSDCVPDLIIGAPGLTGRAWTGYVQVVSGRTGDLIRTFTGDPGSQYGYAVAGAGDVDGDCTPDIVIGAPNHGLFRGAVFLYSGRTGANLLAIHGRADNDYLGVSVALADVNADYRPDLAVGIMQLHWFDHGLVSIYAGTAAAPIGRGCVPGGVAARPPSLSSSGLSISAPASFTGRDAPRNGVGAMLVSIAPAQPIARVLDCVFYVDFGTVLLWQAVTADVLGRFAFELPPLAPALLGRTLAIQVGLFDASPAGFYLTNGVYATVAR